MSKDRLEFVDALRGIAIIGVIIVHASSIVNLTGQARWLANLGSRGVQLFFVISAFTIFLSLSRSASDTNKVRDFFIKRLFRIFPVYWFGMILYTAVYGLASRGWREGPELWHYPVHFVLGNVLHPLTSSSVVPGGWSISCEILFYSTVPLLMIWITSRNRLFIFLFVSVLIFPLINSLLQKTLTPIVFSDIDAKSMTEFWFRWLPGQIGAFAGGIALFFIFQNIDRLTFLKRPIVNAVAVFLILCICISPIPRMVKIIPYHYVFAWLFVILAILLAAIPWKLFVNFFTLFMGKISYSCYLIHFLVLKQVNDFLTLNYSSIFSTQMSKFAGVVVITFVITSILAYGSYLFIETPAIGWGRKFKKFLDSREKGMKADLVQS